MEAKIVDICDILHKTYNASILKDIPYEDIKKYFLLIAKKYKDGTKGNLALMNIIYNTFRGVLPSPKFISGPMSITYQTSSKYNKKIYIFGEYHGKNNECKQIEEAKTDKFIDVTEYFKKIFSNTDKFIDFYIEDELFRTIKPSREQDFLNMLRYDFDNCLNPRKRSKCNYKTVRTHFVDSRIIQKGSRLVASNKIQSLIFDTQKDKSQLKKHLYTIIELSKLNTYEELTDYILKLSLIIPIIKKEIERSDLSQDLIIKNFRQIIINGYKQLFKIEDWNSIQWTNWNEVRKYKDILINIQAPLVDIYTVARMFKTFKKTEYLPSKPMYIIYYSGNNHANMVRNFLTSLSFYNRNSRYMYLDRWTRCLNVEGIDINFK